MHESQGSVLHPIRRNTSLYTDCEVAQAFGKWPHELWALDDNEQEILRWFLVLKSHKAAYAMLPPDKKAQWPRSLRE